MIELLCEVREASDLTDEDFEILVSRVFKRKGGLDALMTYSCSDVRDATLMRMLAFDHADAT